MTIEQEIKELHKTTLPEGGITQIIEALITASFNRGYEVGFTTCHTRVLENLDKIIHDPKKDRLKHGG